MISKDAIVQWLDIDRQTSKKGTVAELFQSYSDKATVVPDFGSEISLEKSNIKIQDWTGWSNILKIKRINVFPENIEWYKLNVNEKEIIVDNRSLVPIYDGDDHFIHGFHGEIKYSYTLTNPAMISSGYVRIRSDIESGQFFTGLIKLFHESCEVGFEIYTKSKFYNANSFHLYGSEDIITVGNKNLYK